MSITDDLYSQLQDGQVSRIGEQLGISQEQAQSAVAAALPLLVGALGRNAQQPQGAADLFGALGRDHAGLDLGSVMSSALGGGGQGGSILEHVFGRRQNNAQNGLGAATGLGSERAGALLRLLAPVVMAFLAKKMYDRRHANDAATSPAEIPAATSPGPGDLTDLLGREQTEIRKRGGLGGSLVSAVLDRDKDGDVDFSDLAASAAIAAGAIGAARRV